MQKMTLRGIVMIGAVALALSGCGQKQPLSGPAAQGSASSPPPADSSQKAPTSAAKDAAASETNHPNDGIHSEIKAYYGDEQQTKLVEQQVAINYKEEKDKYTTALWTLKKAPANSGLVPLAAALGFKSAVLKDKTLTVNVTLSAEGRLGAPGEQMLLEALKKTLFQFPEVGAIDILVDGKPEESLMGHMELPHPIKRPV